MADMNNVTGILAVFLQDGMDYGAGGGEGGYGEGAGGVFVLLEGLVWGFLYSGFWFFCFVDFGESRNEEVV